MLSEMALLTIAGINLGHLAMGFCLLLAFITIMFLSVRMIRAMLFADTVNHKKKLRNRRKSLTEDITSAITSQVDKKFSQQRKRNDDHQRAVKNAAEKIKTENRRKKELLEIEDKRRTELLAELDALGTAK